jgi:hypothetical protein
MVEPGHRSLLVTLTASRKGMETVMEINELSKTALDHVGVCNLPEQEEQWSTACTLYQRRLLWWRRRPTAPMAPTTPPILQNRLRRQAAKRSAPRDPSLRPRPGGPRAPRRASAEWWAAWSIRLVHHCPRRASAQWWAAWSILARDALPRNDGPSGSPASRHRHPLGCGGDAGEAKRSTVPWAPVDRPPLGGPAGAGGDVEKRQGSTTRLDAGCADDADDAGVMQSPTGPPGGAFGFRSKSPTLLVGDNPGQPGVALGQLRAPARGAEPRHRSSNDAGAGGNLRVSGRGRASTH